MKRLPLLRLPAAVLSLALTLAPAAQALTPQQAGELLESFYIDTIPQSVLEQPTIDEMLDALGDPYTEYFTPQEYQAFLGSMSDTAVVGIGVSYTANEEGLPLIQTVPENSPAAKGGLRPGDVLTAVDGKTLSGMEWSEIALLTKGEEGTTVSITYRRDGKEHTVTLTRALVVFPATTSELIDGHIGYISCTTFGEETAGHVQEALETYGSQADVWIMDLRGNGGGLITAAQDTAGLFTGPGPIAYLRDNSGQYSIYSYRGDYATSAKLIVLVDSHSASASELFASAIRDCGAGIVLGTRTYGKGVAQSVFDQNIFPTYFADGDALKVTSARFFSHNGNTTDQIGVIPDLLLSPEDTADAAYLLSGADPSGDTSGVLRVDLGSGTSWPWYIDLESASSPEYKAAFQALLDSIPDNKNLWLGTGGAAGWQRTSAAEVAGACGLTYNAPYFPDQEESDYSTALSVLKSYDLIRGRTDGLFHPQDSLTRAELCQILAEALNCSVPNNASPFSDVADDAWYAPAVTVMSNMGLVSGTGGGLFRPDDPVDHQQLITILARMIQRMNLSFYEDAKTIPEGVENIVELSRYADWAKSSVWLLGYSQTNLLGGTLNLLWDDVHEIDPTAPAARDQAAWLLYRLLSYTDILPA